ncbi:MAG: glycosyltransferase [Rhodospirillales bacterium]|nr:glycosyltransferase [Rhodospirillales bacterium]
MRSVFFWEAAGLSLTQANPYGGLLARGLAAAGVELVAGHAEEFTQAWLEEKRGAVDVLHLNWPHYMYDAPDLAERVARSAELIANLALARELGYKVIWTVHNLFPHDSQHRELDRLVRLALTQCCTALIVHCEHARRLVQNHFHRTDKVFVIPHGHFIDAYPNTMSRAEARRQLGIGEDQFVYLFFGNVRRYKGLEPLLATFQALPDAHNVLLLAAKSYNTYGDDLVAHARQADPRIIVRPARFFANEEFQLFFNAADVGVFPFVDVLTSGSTITALSFGLPVIVPAVGCLPELVDAEVGILYNQQQPGALATAMHTIQQRDLGQLRQAAYQRAQSLDWTTIGRRTLAVYQL